MEVWTAMLDIIFSLSSLAFYVAAILYTKFCEGLR
jgi:hypothetical protein